jgi:hypothetical protein
MRWIGLTWFSLLAEKAAETAEVREFSSAFLHYLESLSLIAQYPSCTPSFCPCCCN